MRLLRGPAIAGMILLCAWPASAQIANLPSGVQAKLASFGPVLTPELVRDTQAALLPLVLARARTGITITRDVEYGPDARQRLDVFQPATGRDLPVVIYVPGGGYVAGNKNSNEGIYSNIGTFFARQGMLGITANYRLAPQHPWPAGAQDVGLVVAWAKANAARHGGNPERVFLFAHSAGATHAASYVFDPALHPAGGPGVVAAILVSGVYRVTPESAASPNVKAYFGADASLYEARSPINHVGASKVPLFLAIAEFDPPFLAQPNLELAQRVCARDGKCPPLAWLKGHNHISEVSSIDSDDQELSGRVLAFIRAVH